MCNTSGGAVDYLTDHMFDCCCSCCLLCLGIPERKRKRTTVGIGMWHMFVWGKVSWVWQGGENREAAIAWMESKLAKWGHNLKMWLIFTQMKIRDIHYFFFLKLLRVSIIYFFFFYYTRKVLKTMLPIYFYGNFKKYREHDRASFQLENTIFHIVTITGNTFHLTLSHL